MNAIPRSDYRENCIHAIIIKMEIVANEGLPSVSSIFCSNLVQSYHQRRCRDCEVEKGSPHRRPTFLALQPLKSVELPGLAMRQKW
jgi:hypothetical protein